MTEPVQEEPIVHRYLSTACHHAVTDNRPELHFYCKSMTGYQGEKRAGKCKFCDAVCECVCHTPGWDKKETGLRVITSDEDMDLGEEDDNDLDLDDNCVECEALTGANEEFEVVADGAGNHVKHVILPADLDEGPLGPPVDEY